jgi:GNAT superfamily N-acetyltransferase
MPISDVIVRPVRLSDAADLRDNCFPMNTLEQANLRIETNMQRAEEKIGLQLVAEMDGVVVGTCGFKRQAHPLEAHRAELVDLVVRGDHRRQGIARRLVEECCVQAAAYRCAIMEASCRGGTPAERVYPRLGFIEWGRLPGGLIEPWGEGDVYDLACFYRPLEPVPGE